jgi:hypothetical protein
MGDWCGNGAHRNAWNCNQWYATGQNLCCPRAISEINTFDSLVSRMYQCLQQMWDEGQPTSTGEKGHWWAMKNPIYKYVSCGFAFANAAEGGYSVLMTQNFANDYNGGTTPLLPSTVSNSPPTKPPTDPPTGPSYTPPPTTPTPPTRFPTQRRFRRRRRGLEEGAEETIE